ncbi:MAG TPA: porin [Bacteroidota bacterium]|nr:porin [Bacteroidota bacterium]
MKTFSVAVALFLTSGLAGQEKEAKDSLDAPTRERISEIKGQLDGMSETLAELKTFTDALRKIKISGYIQSQFQLATGERINTFAGGNSAEGVRSRFVVRRGRLKVAYDNELTQYVLQIDVTQNGVGIKDAYLWMREPWLRMFGLTAGVFNRPFGFEVGYSSGSRETPERARIIQTLFPGERELGAQVEFSTETGVLSHFNFKAGLFNGTGPTANDNDNYKDFIGRAGFQLPFQEENITIDGGVSLYAGKVRSTSRYVYSFNSALNQYFADSSTTNVGKYFSRNYLGADVQLYYDSPLLGGLSLRGEYVFGEQPGTSSANTVYNPGTASIPLYQRKFSGWYLTLVQNIGLDHQFVAKYDLFDPQIDGGGHAIGAPAVGGGSSMTAADVKYATVGIGWNYHYDANIKLVVYYDVVTNEKVNPTATGSLLGLRDDLKDNVLTVRLQYKF